MKKLRAKAKNYLSLTRKYYLSRQPQFLFIALVTLFLCLIAQVSFLSEIFNPYAIIFIVLLLAIFVLGLPKRFILLISLISLFMIPFLMIFQFSNFYIEKMGDFVYGFLVIALIQSFQEFIKNKER